MTTARRITRPSQLPRQRGSHTSAPGVSRDAQTARVLAHPAGRPPGRPTSPRSTRRAPRIDWSGIAESGFGFVLVVLTVAATVVAVGLVGAWALGL